MHKWEFNDILEHIEPYTLTWYFNVNVDVHLIILYLNKFEDNAVNWYIFDFVKFLFDFVVVLANRFHLDFVFEWCSGVGFVVGFIL